MDRALPCWPMRMKLAEPAEIVIWSTASLLAVLLGIGLAFFLWFGLRGEEHAWIVPVLVAGFGTGVFLLGMASKQVLIRAVVALFAVALVLSYIVGSPSFAKLV
jgi:hypothetical protein